MRKQIGKKSFTEENEKQGMLESERVPGMSGLREIGWIEENIGTINRCKCGIVLS